MIFTRYRLAMWALFLAGVYFLLALLVKPALLIVIFNGVFLGVAVAVAIVYTPLVWFTLFKYKFDRVAQLSVGIALLWINVIGQRFWSFLFRLNGSPESWLYGHFLSFITFVAIVGGALFVTAPGYPSDTKITPIDAWGENRNLLLGLGFIGGLTTFVLSVWPGVNF